MKQAKTKKPNPTKQRKCFVIDEDLSAKLKVRAWQFMITPAQLLEAILQEWSKNGSLEPPQFASTADSR